MKSSHHLTKSVLSLDVEVLRTVASSLGAKGAIAHCFRVASHPCFFTIGNWKSDFRHTLLVAIHGPYCALCDCRRSGIRLIQGASESHYQIQEASVQCLKCWIPM